MAFPKDALSARIIYKSPIYLGLPKRVEMCGGGGGSRAKNGSVDS